LRLVVASSATEEELRGLLKVCGADEFIEGKTSSNDAERSEPDPDIVQAALKDVALPPSDVLMLGDTPYDVEAAGRAGVPVIGLRCGGWDDAGLAGAAAVYEDPADLLAHYDSSPLAGASAGSRGVAPAGR
jgi:phosphoglycolate phosphatase-like HAD superfamily hydrolase